VTKAPSHSAKLHPIQSSNGTQENENDKRKERKKKEKKKETINDWAGERHRQ
jgi:hypothetical protein